jgi:hypothetical protein
MSCATKQKLYLQILEKLFSPSSSSFVKVLFFTKTQICSSDLHFQKTCDKTKTVDLKKKKTITIALQPFSM